MSGKTQNKHLRRSLLEPYRKPGAECQGAGTTPLQANKRGQTVRFAAAMKPRGNPWISMVSDVKSISHTSWNCKYRIVFAPKYRRKVFYGGKRLEIVKILKELCKWKCVTILEGKACHDHIHILVEIPFKISVFSFMGFIKGKSSLMIYERWSNIKCQYRNREFWCRGYYVDTVGKNAVKIREYISNQLKEAQLSDQLTLDLNDPFTGRS